MFFKGNKQTQINFPIKNLDFPNDPTEKEIEIKFQNF